MLYIVVSILIFYDFTFQICFCQVWEGVSPGTWVTGQHEWSLDMIDDSHLSCKTVGASKVVFQWSKQACSLAKVHRATHWAPWFAAEVFSFNLSQWNLLWRWWVRLHPAKAHGRLGGWEASLDWGRAIGQLLSLQEIWTSKVRHFVKRAKPPKKSTGEEFVTKNFVLCPSCFSVASVLGGQHLRQCLRNDWNGSSNECSSWSLRTRTGGPDFEDRTSNE